MHPFRDGDAHATLRNVIDQIVAEIGNLENEYVLGTSKSELEQYYTEKAFVEPLVLYPDDVYIKDESATQVNVGNDPFRMSYGQSNATVRGTKLTISLPFSGDKGLWRLKPSTYSLSPYPDITILENEIEFVISFPDDSADSTKIRSDIDQTISTLMGAVQNLKANVESHNNSLEAPIRSALERKVSRAKAATGAVTELGIPIRRKNEPSTFTLPAIRRKRPIERPKASTKKFTPEPVLAEEQYQHILEVLLSMSLVIERSPQSFRDLDEEAIRDHFLIQLNGHYEGTATGETFNASGKTDILIREGDRNVFIAECKFWRGPKGFDEAIDQLLSYLTWRDSKCALLIFNRNKDSESVKTKMHQVVKGRSEHVKTEGDSSESDYRYVLVKEDEPGKEIILTTQLYDIPSW